MISYTVKYFAGALVFIYACFIAFVAFSYVTHPNYLYQTDLLASFLTGARIIRGGNVDNLYDFEAQLEFQNKVTAPVVRNRLLPFRNIPLVGFFYIPLTFLKLQNATVVVFVINILLLALFHRMFVRFAGRLGRTRGIWLISLGFWPSAATLLAGQNTGALLVLLALMYILLLNEKHYLAGVTGSLLLFRPQYALFLPFLLLLIKKKKEFLTGFLTSAFLLAVINILISGFSVLLKYPDFVMATETPDYGNRLDQITSLYFLFKQLFPSTASSVLIFVNILFYALVLILYYLFWGKHSFSRNFIIGILTISIFSIHSLSHDLIILLIPIYLLMGKTNRSLHDNVLLFILFLSPVLVLFVNAAYVTTAIFTVIFLMIISCRDKWVAG